MLRSRRGCITGRGVAVVHRGRRDLNGTQGIKEASRLIRIAVGLGVIFEALDV